MWCGTESPSPDPRREKRIASRTYQKKNLNRTEVDTVADSTCPDCGSTESIYENGELVCTQCGLVLTDHRIDTGPEWRACTADEKNARARTGAPTSLAIHDKGLSTMIDWRDHDSTGKRFTASQRAQIYRLRKWQRRTRVHSSLERNLAQAMTELDRLSSQMGLTKTIKENAASLYRRLILGRYVKSRSIDAMVGAAVYAACRLLESPRSLEEIADHSRVGKKKLGASYRLLVTKLGIRMPVSEPANYVPRLVSDLGLPAEVQLKALEIIERAKASRGLVTGRDPRGLAAAAIYIASILTNNRVTQRQIAQASGVTEVTIRNRYKELVSRLKITMMP
ncbi:MAG: transcription initiation factor IIB [Candidatus Thorarchaeota archaeon]|nr:MAG: transcription initiation factor IIB [Candidatus Thorarchaeota archaeon]